VIDADGTGGQAGHIQLPKIRARPLAGLWRIAAARVRQLSSPEQCQVVRLMVLHSHAA
jgi:hypothetical protein